MRTIGLLCCCRMNKIKTLNLIFIEMLFSMFGHLVPMPGSLNRGTEIARIFKMPRILVLKWTSTLICYWTEALPSRIFKNDSLSSETCTKLTPGTSMNHREITNIKEIVIDIFEPTQWLLRFKCLACKIYTGNSHMRWTRCQFIEPGVS